MNHYWSDTDGILALAHAARMARTSITVKAVCQHCGTVLSAMQTNPLPDGTFSWQLHIPNCPCGCTFVDVFGEVTDV